MRLVFVYYSIIFSLWFSSNTTTVNCSFWPIIQILQHFRIVQPAFQNTNNFLDNEEMFKLNKELSRNDVNIYFISETMHSSCSHSIITFTKLESFEWKITSTSNVPNIVISHINNFTELDQVKLSLIDEVYFLDWASLNVYETYTINNIPIINHLGHFKSNLNSLSFYASNGYISSFEKRRGNFHGLHLRAMTEKSWSPNILDLSEHFPSRVTYFSNNDTFDVTDHTKGSFSDLLHYLEEHFNFSTRIYKRKDSKWGYPKLLPNGTEIVDGMIHNLVENSADFIIAPLAILSARLPYVDYLQPMRDELGIVLRL